LVLVTNICLTIGLVTSGMDMRGGSYMHTSRRGNVRSKC
jgi:hypothetical protein